MPVDGRIRAYYWNLRVFLEEKAAILNPEHPDYRFPEDDNLVYYTHHLEGCLVFIDGSRLRFELVLGFDEAYNVVEKRYFYGYFAPSEVRRFQYDNSPHHPHLSTFPHHLHKGPVPGKAKDIALNCDLAQVSFVAVVSKIEEMLMR